MERPSCSEQIRFCSSCKKGDSSHYSHTLYATSPRSCSQIIARKTEKCYTNCCECSQLHQRKALNHRLFKAFCKKIGAKHSVLLYHSEVRWLSRGRVLTRVFKLRKEIEMFLRQRGSSLVVYFESENFILSMAYLSDIFTHLNDLNISIQGKGINMISGREKISALTSKLSIWKNRINCENYANFPKLNEVSTSTTSLREHIVIQIKEHLHVLGQSFERYFHHGGVSDLQE